MLISIRRLSILCLISTTLVRISTKCLPVWFYYYEARSSFRMETMKKLCVPVQGCEDVEEEFDVNVGACRWVGSNHENKIGLKRGFPSSVGDLRVSKSKPIAKYCPDVMWLGGNFWGPGSGVPGKIFIVCAPDTNGYWWVWIGDSCWHPYHWCWIRPSEILVSGTEYEENEAREIRRQIEQFEVTILYDVTWNDHITHVISKAFAST